ncbi:alpha/beta hydrolase [Kurthia sibirica]|uniref:Alpha/beta hydrolase n=1 Tax=Kurthia sibirica TaxID=202750 RepID=A0A2U3AJM6_9BACL|nr:alpha/beta hydrolase [Kurthia sibirica]PWI24756.1 alpha/beta hydrolase [Kurthia sibirica]GEK35124.1 phospholipase [Kurthia sibirica]
MWKWEAENQAKAVIVIIHSAYEHHKRYAWLIEKLRVSGFHVITGDLPGHGEQSKNKGVHDESLKDYEKYIKLMIYEATQYNVPIFILGHGMGATFAMHAIGKFKYEVAGVIMTSPWLHLQHQQSKMATALKGVSKIAGGFKMTHDINIKHLTRSYDFYVDEKDDPYYSTTVTIRWYHELQQFMKAIAQVEGRFKDLPVLMMNGKNDKIVDIAYNRSWLEKQKLSDYQYKEWPNCYHDLYQEPERDLIYQYVEDFVFNRLRTIGYII